MIRYEVDAQDPTRFFDLNAHLRFGVYHTEHDCLRGSDVVKASLEALVALIVKGLNREVESFVPVGIQTTVTPLRDPKTRGVAVELVRSWVRCAGIREAAEEFVACQKAFQLEHYTTRNSKGEPIPANSRELALINRFELTEFEKFLHVMQVRGLDVAESRTTLLQLLRGA